MVNFLVYYVGLRMHFLTIIKHNVQLGLMGIIFVGNFIKIKVLD